MYLGVLLPSMYVSGDILYVCTTQQCSAVSCHLYTRNPFSVVKECDDFGCNTSINFEFLISGVWPVLSWVMEMLQTRELWNDQ